MNGYLNDDFQFDLEGNDYILERCSIFTSGDLAKQNYEKLSHILKNYQQIDINLLEMLNYQRPMIEHSELKTYDFKNHYKKANKCKFYTPLHIALEAKNTRIINLLLLYMSKIEVTADMFIKDIFNELINY